MHVHQFGRIENMSRNGQPILDSTMNVVRVQTLLVPQASIRSLNMFTQPKVVIAEAWKVIVSLLKSGAINACWNPALNCRWEKIEVRENFGVTAD